MDGRDTISRSGMRAKKRKTNIILNSLIAIVLVLIIVVATSIFAGGNDEAASNDKPIEEKAETTDKLKNSNSEKEKSQSEKESKNSAEREEKAASQSENKPSRDKADDEASNDEEEADDENEEGSEDDEPVVTAGGSDTNVKNTIVNPGWKPIGTSQTGEHPAGVYEQGSTDWQEMLQAVTYATGIDESNMTVWRLENNGTNRSVATITAKDTKQPYRVYIEWVDKQGWKPVRVEELIENDKGQ
ncbi:DNA primase [Bacillus sp. V3-13]|nr:DNA primase [Bacillus sp. V3-13]